MQRELGRTGRKVFPLGLGCMGMSWIYAESRRDDEHSIAVIRQARDAGVQLIDTAGLYGDGHNEELVGRALRGQRDDVVIATKGGLVVDDLAARRVHRDGRPETLRRQVDESLRRLDVEQIDLFYLHRVDPAVPIGESWEALSAVVDAGKVRWLGLSEVTIAQAESAHAIHPVTAIQSELSLWTRDPLGHGAEQGTGREQAEPTGRGSSDGTSDGASNNTSNGDLLAWTRDHGVSFVPFAPLGRGYLTGTATSAPRTRASHRRHSPATRPSPTRSRGSPAPTMRHPHRSVWHGCSVYRRTSSRFPAPAAVLTCHRTSAQHSSPSPTTRCGLSTGCPPPQGLATELRPSRRHRCSAGTGDSIVVGIGVISAVATAQHRRDSAQQVASHSVLLRGERTGQALLDRAGALVGAQQ